MSRDDRLSMLRMHHRQTLWIYWSLPPRSPRNSDEAFRTSRGVRRFRRSEGGTRGRGQRLVARGSPTNDVVLSIRRALGAMARVLGGVDAVVFTGGVGENSAPVRRDATSALRFEGLELAEDAERAEQRRLRHRPPGSRVRVLVLRAREDLAILKKVLRLRGHADERVEASS